MTATASKAATGTCSLRLMNQPPQGGGQAQFQVQYPPGTPQDQQFLAPGHVVNLPINPNWGGRLETGAILDITATNG